MHFWICLIFLPGYQISACATNNLIPKMVATNHGALNQPKLSFIVTKKTYCSCKILKDLHRTINDP